MTIILPPANDPHFEAASPDVLERIEAKLDSLTRIVGFCGSDEHGLLIGTGIAGDLARLKARVDARFSRDDGRARYLAGAAAAASLSLAGLWWLVHARLEALFR
jgi:hypothetical protein